MKRGSSSADGVLLNARLQVLRTGLFRFRAGDTEAGDTLRRIGKTIESWAREEQAVGVLEAARKIHGATGSELLERGEQLEVAVSVWLADERGGSGGTGLVLAVEDSPEDAALLATVLEGQGWAVRTVPTAAEAERVLGQGEVALVILDLGLPDSDGRTLLLRLRESDEYRSLPVVVLTGKTRPDVKAESLALGANAVYEKPIDPSALSAAIARELHDASERRTRDRTDPVTGLLNREGFRAEWEEMVPGSKAALGILSLDRFHHVEERFGAEVADRVMASVGRLVARHAPEDASCARWGRDDFLFLCRGTGRDPMVPLLRSLLDDVRRLAHEDPGRETFRVTASGAVVDVESGAALDAALGQVRERLTVAEEAGGNTMDDAVGESDVITVLLAEDDPMSAGIVQHRLEKEGFRVLHFPDGAKALEGALANRVHLAILDVKMPEMDGFELLERLRKVPAFEHTPIMMLTSMGREEDVVRGFKLGANDYMLKPFSPVELVARIRRLLDR